MKTDISIIDTRFKNYRKQFLRTENALSLSKSRDLFSREVSLCVNCENQLTCLNIKPTNHHHEKLSMTTDGDAMLLVIAKGFRQCERDPAFRQCKCSGTLFNFFYLAGKNEISFNITEEKDPEFRFIFMKREMFEFINREYPTLYDNKIDIEQGCIPLFNPDKILNIDICEILHEIMDTTFKGEVGSLFLKGKAHLILALSLQHKESELKRSVNEVRLNKAIEVKNILEQRYANPPTIKELALAVGSNATTIKLAFKEYYGTTIYNYIQDIRMSRAKKLLILDDKNIKEIAAELGFVKQGNFTVAFKKRYGILPSQLTKA